METHIKKSKKNLLGVAILLAAFIIFIFFTNENGTLRNWILFGLIAGLLYLFVEVAREKSELIFSKTGLEIRHYGYHSWDLIESINIELNKDQENYTEVESLKISLKVGQEITLHINNWEETGTELIALFKSYKPDINFLGYIID